MPFGVEGAADRAARAFALSLGRESVVIENVPGSGGLRGVARANALAAKGEATLLLATPTTSVLLPLRSGAEGTPAQAFVPLASFGGAPNVLLVSPRLGVHDVASLVERAKRERLVYASAGAGQTIHLCTALFCRQAGIALDHRPYDAGSATAYADIEAGRVHVYFDNALACDTAIASGIVVPLAVSARERTATLPAVPTLRECGFPDHALEVWFGAFGANLDEAMRVRVVSAVADPALSARLAAMGLSGGVRSGTHLARTIESSRPGWCAALAAA